MHLAKEVGPHRPIWMPPVAKAVAVVMWVATEVDNDTHDNEANKGDHLDTAKPKLEFAKYTNAE